MELEDLKEKVSGDNINYSRAELDDIFNLRTKRTVNRINRNMLVDLLLMLLTTALLVTATFIIGLRSRYMVSSQIIGFSMLIFIHYRIKYVLLNKVSINELGIKNGATQLVRLLNKYTVGYKTVLALLASILLSKYYLDLSHDWYSVISKWPYIMTALVVGYLLASLIARMMYQKDIDQLQKVIDSLE